MAQQQQFRLTEDGRIYRKGKRIYANKDVYEGEFVDGLKHGRGILRYSNGNKYVGEFVDDFLEGFGLFIYSEVDDSGVKLAKHRYEGTFVRGKRHGKGLYVSGKNDTYTGMFENNVYHGQGTLQTHKGDVIEGDWFKGRASGKHNKVTFKNGDVYMGAMKSGLFHGEGEFLWRRNMGSYKGTWFKGKPSGRGTRKFVNGNIFSGSFVDGRINGDGVMSYANGDQYIGSWVSGHKHGKGVMRFASGDRYEGNFHNGFFYGQGKFVWSDGSYYEGDFLKTRVNPGSGVSFPDPDGKRNGVGIRVWTNGNRYEGLWEDDNMHGTGVLQKIEGGKYRGDFWNGMKHGQAAEEFGNIMNVDYICPMGVRHKGEGYCTYNGHYKVGHFHGEGEFVCQDGRSYVGEWMEGKRHGKGVQTYLRDGEEGDPQRYFIGGVGSLYRFKLYSGEWCNGEKDGEGTATYVNGESIQGRFVKGRPHGVLLYRYVGGSSRYATYERGHRKGWTTDAEIRAERMLTWLGSVASSKNLADEGDY